MNMPRQILSVAFALICSSVLASAIVPGRAVVIRVVGSPSVVKSAGGTLAITQGMVLGAGDTIATGVGSAVTIDLGMNGNFLNVDSDTTLKLDVLDIANVSRKTVTTTMTLARGSVSGNVKNKLTAASKYEIKTASGVAGIRGTVYSIRSDNTLVVFEGTVDFVFTRNGVEQVVRVRAGQQFKAGVDAAPIGLTESNLRIQTLITKGVSFEEIESQLGGTLVDTGNPLAVSVNEPPPPASP